MTSSEVLNERVDLSSLRPGSSVDVETRSRHYHIECRGDGMRISGHPDFCPNPVAAHLQGSLDKDGALELGLIEPGMRFMFFLKDGRPVVTSKVLHVHVEPRGAGL